MKHLSAIVTVGLAGLSFAPIAAAQSHPDRARPDSIMRAERFSAAERMHISERGQEGSAERASGSHEVATRSFNAAAPTPEAARVGLVGAAAIARVAARGTSTEDSGSSASHNNISQRSENSVASQRGGPAAGAAQHLGLVGAAALQRVSARTATAEDAGSSASHINVAMQSANAAAVSAQISSAAAPHAGMAARMAIAAVMSRTAVGEDTGSSASHVNVESHSPNRTQ